ncbi:MAG: VOC family protein [Betaproteobacteria bacterium]
MRVDHVALWTRNPEQLRDFYSEWFGARSNDGYVNPARRFRSYFLSFGGGARIEIMQVPDLSEPRAHPAPGYAHIALALGSDAAVDQLTARLSTAGFVIVDGPRRTGDGYYESVVLDPDGNRIELTV